MIRITARLSIPTREIQYTYSTSTGPGGQHVNKVATRVTLLFDLISAHSLTQSQRNRIWTKLSTRINKHGVMRVSSSKHRSQKANKEAAIERFKALLQEVLKHKKRRKQTSVPASQKRKRIETKRIRSETKRLRSRLYPSSE